MLSGLRAAHHDVIFFLDGDDVWHPQKLKHCMGQTGEDVKFYTHDLWYMDSTGRAQPRESRVSKVLGRIDPSKVQGKIEACLFEHGDYVWLGSAFGVSRSRGAVDAFIAFCEKRDYLITCYQDWPLALWVALEGGGTMAFVNQKLFGYRVHGENYSGAS